jgi:ketosteroid isomerase-like protein
MSEDKMEIARISMEARAAGDAETAQSVLDPDVEWAGTVGGLDDGRVARGRDEVARGFADYFATWETIDIRADEYIDAGHDEVVIFVHEVARGRRSGVEVETDITVILTIRDGKIVRVRPFMDRSTALEAAGLSE